MSERRVISNRAEGLGSCGHGVGDDGGHSEGDYLDELLHRLLQVGDHLGGLLLQPSRPTPNPSVFAQIARQRSHCSFMMQTTCEPMGT